MNLTIIQRLLRILGFAGPASRSIPETLPSTECFGDALKRGATLCPVEPSDLPSEFEVRLLDICKADSNVEGVWLMWMSTKGAPPEMLASLLLERPNEPAIRDFIRRANALGGPPFVVAIPDGIPSSRPFYRREADSFAV